MSYVKFERVFIKNEPALSERWVQERIAEEPTILGLGDVVLKDKERMQPRAGRLDLLLQDADGNRRYEVEIQLGATDESHIIRTIEYWDIERKRYPQYDHCAVIIAEDITSRFLNVITLFNGFIPLLAIQMSALRVGGQIGLIFTKVLDQLGLGMIDEDEEVQESADRAYWENKVPSKVIGMADRILDLVKRVDPGFELKYTKFYIGLSKRGDPNNFVIMRPKKTFLRLEPRLARSEEMQERLEAAGLDIMDYDERWGRYRIRLTPEDLEKQKEVIAQVVSDAQRAANE